VRVYRRLFDYAGVFPPAQLPLAQALEHYGRLRAGDTGWLVGPMLVRASQLEADLDIAELGVIADSPLPRGQFAQVEKRCLPGEVAPTSEDLARSTGVVYLESGTDDPTALIDEISATRRAGTEVRAKLRTGGLDPQAFPTPETVAAFIRDCVAAGVPFKATAGLHHPFPTDSDVPGATEHGFVNLLAATGAALAGEDDLVACLTETDPDAFDLATATWHRVGADLSVEAVRAALSSIGSCSIDEPAGYLRDLGVGPVAAS
jgi:hypothetical protein